MSARIKILSESVINRIAAGEVIERPVSVVKELVENSIDAQASSVNVEIENGGRKLIRVRDNGTGMSHDDAFLALERHATSKLKSETDLVGIATMGFRGEALASIASISRLKLLTRDESDTAGTEVLIEGGVLRKSERVGMGTGTAVEVRNLFFNVPVRRKFLKGSGVEAAHIQELLIKLALAFPTVAFTYSEDGRSKIDAPPVHSTFERIHTLYSKDVRENMVAVDHNVGDAHLQGYVARPPYARSNMRSVLTFVNGRSVRDRLVNAAVTRAFSNLMERGRYPLAILFIELPPNLVDVNVHPQKAEVRFVSPVQISQLILDGIHQALMGAPFNPPSGPVEPFFPRPPLTPLARHLQGEREPSDKAPEIEHREYTQVDPAPVHVTPTLNEGGGRFSSLGIVGRLPNSFLVLHSDSELVILDHHAAHERLIFDELMRTETDASKSACQDLLIPKILQYSAVEARALAAHLDLLQDAGFRIEEFGEREFVVKGVPEWLGNSDLEELFSQLVDVMLNTGVRGDPTRFREEVLKSMACQASVKETMSMQVEEIRTLLHDLDHTGSPEVCPHGRPLAVRFPFSEIRRKMGRR
jgi:DNA mismatch repair protein MutL